MKTQTRTKPPAKIPITGIKTKNKAITKAYQLVVEEAITILKQFKEPQHLTYCRMDHLKNDQNTNMIKEFLCYFWNITLSVSPHNKRRQIQLDIGKEGLEKIGYTLTNFLISKIISVILASGDITDAEDDFILNSRPLALLPYFYSTIARGETEYISIFTINTDVA